MTRLMRSVSELAASPSQSHHVLFNEVSYNRFAGKVFGLLKDGTIEIFEEKIYSTKNHREQKHFSLLQFW